MLLDFFDLHQQVVKLRREVLVRNDELGKNQDVLYGLDAAAQVLADLNDFTDDQGRPRKRLPYGPLPALVPLRQLDFAFACEQRNRAHFAQVHAHGVVGLVAEILGEVEVAEFVDIVALFFEVEFRLLQDLDAGAVEVAQQVLELASRREIRQQVVHFVVQDETFFLADFHELLHSTVFVVSTHWQPHRKRLKRRSNSVYNTGDWAILSAPPHPEFRIEVAKLLGQTKRFRQVSAALRCLDSRFQTGAAKLFFLHLQIAQAAARLGERRTLLCDFIGKNHPRQ